MLHVDAAADGDSEYAHRAAIKLMPLALSDERRLDAIGKQYRNGLVTRSSLDYHQVPLPTESVDVLLRMEGRAARRSYGSCSGARAKWASSMKCLAAKTALPICGKRCASGTARIVINDRVGSRIASLVDATCDSRLGK